MQSFEFNEPKRYGSPILAIFKTEVQLKHILMLRHSFKRTKHVVYKPNKLIKGLGYRLC
jgi:hypothetical protein